MKDLLLNLYTNGALIKTRKFRIRESAYLAGLKWTRNPANSFTIIEVMRS
jgi:hypothetical protein